METSEEIRLYERRRQDKDGSIRVGTLKTMADTMESGLCRFSFLRDNKRVETFGTRSYAYIKNEHQPSAAAFEQSKVSYAKKGLFLYYDLPAQAWMQFGVGSLIALIPDEETADLAAYIRTARSDVDARARSISLACETKLKITNGICLMVVNGDDGLKHKIYGTRDKYLIRQTYPDAELNFDGFDKPSEGVFQFFNIVKKDWDCLCITQLKELIEYGE